MSSSLRYIECPHCGFLGAEDYEENNGERAVSCNMCGYMEDLSEIDQDYFDSEEEWEDYHSSLGKDNNVPTKDEIKNVQSTVKFANFLMEEDEEILETFDLDQFIGFAVDKGIRDVGNFKQVLAYYVSEYNKNVRETIKKVYERY